MILKRLGLRQIYGQDKVVPVAWASWRIKAAWISRFLRRSWESECSNSGRVWVRFSKTLEGSGQAGIVDGAGSERVDLVFWKWFCGLLGTCSCSPNPESSLTWLISEGGLGIFSTGTSGVLGFKFSASREWPIILMDISNKEWIP